MNDTIESWTVPAEESGSRYGFHVNVKADTDARPEQHSDCYSDCYSAADVVGWKQDQWRYVVITVTPFLPGVTFDGAAQVVAGVEWGYLNGRWVDKDSIMLFHPLPDMMVMAAEEADEIQHKLT